MRRYSYLPVFVLPLLLTAISAAEPQPHYFAIKMNDKLIGYAVVESETVTQGGLELVRLKSQTSLKVALLGKPRNVSLDSETLLQPVSGKPIRYRLTDTTNEVVRHIESEFTDAAATTWVYREGDDRGEPAETPFPEEAVILGSNNFAHWNLLAHAAAARVQDGTAKITVFLPDTGQLDRFELVRGESREVRVGGAIRKCVSWKLDKADLTFLADEQTQDFVRLELPAQQTVVERADEAIVKLAQKSLAEEVLADQFVQSNVVFDDYTKVTQLTAAIDVKVIGSGIENPVSVLNTRMQKFDGQKEGARIVGTVTIRCVAYRGEDGPAFSSREVDAELAPWVEPSQCIESDHESIVVQAADLTKTAKTRWDAVRQIGAWVHKEIAYTIADSPSARLAMETKKGDCGPHSTLTIAMLRSVGIPARLVGGLVYTPTFGGSFGQHGWVEVHMGPAGWVAIDPTMGEFEQVSATHMKLFEGLGGVVPKMVKVEAFEPGNRDVELPSSAVTRPLPWKLGKKYIYHYGQGNKEIGSETVVIEQIQRDGKDVYEVKSDAKLKLNLLSSLTSSTTLVVAPNARPLFFDRTLSVLLSKTKIECTFTEGSVQEKISGSQNMTRDVRLPAGAYCFDNNLMGGFALICSQLVLEPGKAVTIQTFHPSSLQIIPLTLSPKPLAPIKIGEKDVQCFECQVTPIKNTFWITRDGRFVRAMQGDLLIELSELD